MTINQDEPIQRFEVSDVYNHVNQEIKINMIQFDICCILNAPEKVDPMNGMPL